MNVMIKREYDYAIRICAYLAGNYGNAPIPVSKIASRLFITRAFTTKIIFKLRQHEIVKTVQGKDGGIYLHRPPEQLSLLAILQAMGFDSSINACLKIPDLCPLVDICNVHRFFLEQERTLLRAFASKMIIEFAFSEEDLPPSGQARKNPSRGNREL